MARSDHVNRGHPIVFALLALFGAIEGSISTWLAVKYQHNRNYNSGLRDRVRLLALTSWITFVFAVALAFAYRYSFDNIFISIASHGIFLGLIWVLWTAGAASITASLKGGVNCSTIDYELAYCNQLNAAMGFAWTEWVIVSFGLVILLLLWVSSRRRGEGWTGMLVR